MLTHQFYLVYLTTSMVLVASIIIKRCSHSLPLSLCLITFLEWFPVYIQCLCYRCAYFGVDIKHSYSMAMKRIQRSHLYSFVRSYRCNSLALSLYPFVSISSIQVHWSKNWNERGKEVQQVTPLSYDSLLFAREYSIQQRISSKWVLAKVFTQTHSYTYIMLLTFFLVISILFRLSFAWRVCVCSMSASQKKIAQK